MPAAHVVVVGGGLAGIASAIALAEHGLQVSLIEKHPRLGGRATSYTLPSGETIDNCQHVTLRCCTNLTDFYLRLGVAHSIMYYDRLVFADSKGNHGEVRSRHLPAPLNLVPSFLTFRLLQWKDKKAIAKTMLDIMRAAGKPKAGNSETMLHWLKANGQTPNAIERFWRVVLVSALNEELDRTAASYGIDVFWKAFLTNRNAFGVGVPAVPLESLYASAADRIKRAGGDVRTRCAGGEFLLSNEIVSALRLEDGTQMTADYYISAVPFDRLLKMLPAYLRVRDPFRNFGKLKLSPITSVHLWMDRPVMADPFLTSVDQTIQWVFNKRSGQYLQVVISASYAFHARSQQEIITICRKELADLIPATREAELRRAVVIRENAATFAPEPGCDRWRPDARSQVRNLFLAGDWTRTGWPATMEGAVRSGYSAAEAILALEGKPVRLIQPDLPVSRLVKWFRR
jgi:squalene-associated FAD-dependent desaturase